MEKPLVDKEYLLQKFPGKGGWTYAEIPEVPQDRHAPFGWVKVKGSLDRYTFSNYRLQPMGNGQLFLPVRAEVRKKIGKQAGDFVHVVLYLDHDPVAIPGELLECLAEHPLAHGNFLRATEGEQKTFIDWIYSAKTEKTKVERIVRALEILEKNKKFTDR